MNILLAVTGLFDVNRGVQKYNRNLLNALASVSAGRHKVTVISYGDAKPRAAIPKGCELIACSGDKCNFSSLLVSAARRCDLLIATHISLAPLFPLAKLSNTRCRVYLTLHGIESWKRLSLYGRFCMKFVDLFLPVSDYTCSVFTKNNGISHDRFYKVPNILEATWHSIAQDEINQLKGRHFILCAGYYSRAERYKGADHLIEAFARQVGEYRLVIAGGGDDLPRLRSIANTTSAGGRIYFLDAVTNEQLKWLYHNCVFFALPSSGEGFGIVYLEAMNEGKAVVACRNTGAEEPVRHMTNGLLVEYGNLSELANSLQMLLLDEELRTRLGCNGKALLDSEFTFERLCEHMNKLLSF